MIVVTTPTGKIGKLVLEGLLQRNADVRVIVRDASKLPESVRPRVDVTEGSHNDTEVLEKAFEGAESVFFLVPPTTTAPTLESAYIDFARPAAKLFVSSGVKRVVGVSALGRGTAMAQKAGIVSASLAVDDLIAESGVNYRPIVNPSFMDNLLQQAVPLKAQGMFFSPMHGDRRAPTCAIRDIASSATQQLLDVSWSGFQEIPVLGPEDLSLEEEATILTEVLGRKIRFRQIGWDVFRDRLQQLGVSPAFIQAYVDMALAKDDGLDNAVKRTPENSTPKSFRQWALEVLKPVLEA